MTDNYEKIATSNLEKLYSDLPADLAQRLPAEKEGNRFLFEAFGETCTISPGGIQLGEGNHPSVLHLLISLYALNASAEQLVLEPFQAYKDFPDSGPYAGAFATHTQQILVPEVDVVKASTDFIKRRLNGREAPAGINGDFAFVVYPLPKIALCYIFYEADEEFPASVTCLFSNNAQAFLPVDALADVGEYTSRKILEIIVE